MKTYSKKVLDCPDADRLSWHIVEEDCWDREGRWSNQPLSYGSEGVSPARSTICAGTSGRYLQVHPQVPGKISGFNV